MKGGSDLTDLSNLIVGGLINRLYVFFERGILVKKDAKAAGCV